MSLAASFNAFVSFMSLSPGKRFPEGWLWASINPPASFSKAVFNIIFRSTTVEEHPPFEILSTEMTLFPLWRSITQHSAWSRLFK